MGKRGKRPMLSVAVKRINIITRFIIMKDKEGKARFMDCREAMNYRRLITFMRRVAKMTHSVHSYSGYPWLPIRGENIQVCDV